MSERAVKINNSAVVEESIDAVGRETDSRNSGKVIEILPERLTVILLEDISHDVPDRELS